MFMISMNVNEANSWIGVSFNYEESTLRIFAKCGCWSSQLFQGENRTKSIKTCMPFQRMHHCCDGIVNFFPWHSFPSNETYKFGDVSGDTIL